MFEIIYRYRCDLADCTSPVIEFPAASPSNVIRELIRAGWTINHRAGSITYVCSTHGRHDR